MKRGLHSCKDGKTMVTIIIVILILLIVIPTIVVLWEKTISYTHNYLLVDMSNVQLEIVSNEGLTIYDEDDYLLSAQVKRGSDEIDLEYIYVVIDVGGNSRSYLVNALESDMEGVYYFGEINEKPDKISVFASIPLAKEGADSVGNFYLANISSGDLDEDEIIAAGDWVYLANDRIMTNNCEGLDGVIFDKGSYCFIDGLTKGYCDSIGYCVAGECTVDSNCYRGSECEVASCAGDYVCEYSNIEGCVEPEGFCGDYVINKNEGEECDNYLFGEEECGDGFVGELKCTSECKIDRRGCVEG